MRILISDGSGLIEGDVEKIVAEQVAIFDITVREAQVSRTGANGVRNWSVCLISESGEPARASTASWERAVILACEEAKKEWL